MHDNRELESKKRRLSNAAVERREKKKKKREKGASLIFEDEAFENATKGIMHNNI